MPAGSTDSNGVYQFGSSDTNATFHGLLNIAGAVLSATIGALKTRLTSVETSRDNPTVYVAGSSTARDSHWGAPSTSSAQLALQNLGATTMRTDTGTVERYYGLYNSSTNQGGKPAAGWYPLQAGEPIFQVGRGSAQAILASAHTLVSGAYGTPGLNEGFTSFASGVLTVAKAGWYRLSVLVIWPAAATTIVHQVLVNSTTTDSAAMLTRAYSASGQTTQSSNVVYLSAADVLRLYVYSSTAQNLGTNPRDLNLSLEYLRP